MRERLVQEIFDGRDTIKSLTETLREKEQELIGEIKEWRIEQGFSLRSFAKALGVSSPYWSDIEKGRRHLSEIILNKIIDLKM